MEFKNEFKSLEYINTLDDHDEIILDDLKRDIKQGTVDKRRIKKIIGPITLMRGITQECTIHNEIN